MIRILAVTNQKGGVGKTTTAVNLAASLANLGQRVLLIDLDPQGNATMGSGIDKRDLADTVYQLLVGAAPWAKVCLASPGGYDVLPANRELAGAEIDLVNLPRREHRLADALAPHRLDYDYVLIDCPPSLSLLTINGLCAANAMLIPMQCEYFALEGLSDLVDTLRRIRRGLNPTIDIEGILRTMFDARSMLSRQVAEQLAQHFPGKVFETVIPRNVRLAEAPSHGCAALHYDRNSSGSRAYLGLAAELVARHAPAGVAA
ncbi:MAG: ParA family protein [Betaproteobacteria bacterium]|nr:ParA family protein [Betaproteobacteria bacterium]